MESGSFRQKRIHKILFIGPDRAELDRIENCLVRPQEQSGAKRAAPNTDILGKEAFVGAGNA